MIRQGNDNIASLLQRAAEREIYKLEKSLNPGGEMQWKTKNFGNQDCQDLGKF